MASMVVVQPKQPSSYAVLPSSFSDFNGTRLTASLQCKRKLWQPKGALLVTAPSVKKILIMGGTSFQHEKFHPLLIGSYSPKLSRPDSQRFLVKLARNPIPSPSISSMLPESKDFAVPRRNVLSMIVSGYILSLADAHKIAMAQSVAFREYIDAFDGYSFKYPGNWIQVRGAGADIFFRDPFVLDENISVEISSPSSSRYKTVEDLGSPEEAGKKVLKQYLTEFMSTRLGVRRESSILSTSSRVADDGKLYYQVEVNIKSYASNNELAVMPQDRVVRMEWDRRYLSVLGVENNQLYELRLQTPEKEFAEEENDLRTIMDSFRVNKVAA